MKRKIIRNKKLDPRDFVDENGKLDSQKVIAKTVNATDAQISELLDQFPPEEVRRSFVETFRLSQALTLAERRKK